ncbi:MAG: hypothetical protein AAAB16_24630 [Pseudomonas sp.]
MIITTAAITGALVACALLLVSLLFAGKAAFGTAMGKVFAAG